MSPRILEIHLTPKQEAWAPHALLVDKEGAIYVFSGKDNTMTRFDANGRETLRKDFKSGRDRGSSGSSTLASPTTGGFSFSTAAKGV